MNPFHYLVLLHHGNPPGFWFCFGALAFVFAAIATDCDWRRR